MTALFPWLSFLTTQMQCLQIPSGKTLHAAEGGCAP